SSNTVAQNLYKKYGLLISGIRKEYYHDHKEDALIMWKQLREVF
ncbi:MAG: ribosomal-protein-alanine N-acetyltransferase, partial [Peptostreptococcus anaerobius]